MKPTGLPREVVHLAAFYALVKGILRWSPNVEPLGCKVQRKAGCYTTLAKLVGGS